jgi:hypothetical protein
MLRWALRSFGVVACFGVTLALPSVAADTAECLDGVLTLPGEAASVAFEEAGSCRGFASAWNRRADGRDLRDRDESRVELLDWIGRNLEATDVMRIDRFGRAHLTRCGDGTTGEELNMTANVVLGPEGDQKTMYMVMQLPPGAQMGSQTCAVPSPESPQAMEEVAAPATME